MTIINEPHNALGIAKDAARLPDVKIGQDVTPKIEEREALDAQPTNVLSPLPEAQKGGLLVCFVSPRPCVVAHTSASQYSWT